MPENEQIKWLNRHHHAQLEDRLRQLSSILLLIWEQIAFEECSVKNDHISIELK
jgi:hypothetical protein